MGRRLSREYLFGISPCLAAFLAKRREVLSLLLCDSMQRSELLRPEVRQIISLAEKTEGCYIKYKSANLLDKLSGNRPHQKVLLDCRVLDYEDHSKIGDLSRAKKSASKDPAFVLALDQVQDPMNFGAVLRSALYFGVDAVIATKEYCCKLSPVVSKASSGAMEWLPVYNVGNLPQYLMGRRDAGWDVIGSVSVSHTKNNSMDESVKKITEMPRIEKNTIVVIGNEGIGMRKEVHDCCSTLTTIMPPRKLRPGMESLNVSVATGILLQNLLKPMPQDQS